MDFSSYTKEAAGIIKQLVSTQKSRMLTFGDTLFSLTKIVESNHIDPSRKGAYEVIQTHAQIVEDIIFSHSDCFRPYEIKVFARIKTRWDKAMLRDGENKQSWGAFVKTKEYQNDIQDITGLIEYVEHRIWFEPLRNMIWIALGITFFTLFGTLLIIKFF